MMGKAYLWPPLQDEVASGELTLGEALLRQSVLNQRLVLAEADVAAGRVHVADEAYFERLREHVRKVAAKG